MSLQNIKDVTRKQRTPRHLPIRIHQQEFAFSCVAAVAQIVYEFHTGNQLSHEDAIQLTGCNPDGAELITVGQVMKKLCGSTYRSLRTLAAAKGELHKGNLIVSHDEISYIDSHAVLFCGATKTGVYVCDPNTATISWKSDKFIRESGANEFLVIYPPAPGTRRKPSPRRLETDSNQE